MLSNRVGFTRKTSAGASVGHTARLAATLRGGRHSLAVQLLESLAGWHKYDQTIKLQQAERNSFISDNFYVFIDYLGLYFLTGDATYKYLYIAEKLKQLHDTSLTLEQDDTNRWRVTEGDIKVLCDHVRTEVGPEEAALLESLLREIQRVITTRGRKELHILLIGDCIFLDVRGFLTPLLLEDGITIRPTFITSKNPAEQRNELRRMAGQPFDAIFYSPFTYEFSLPLVTLHNWRHSLTSHGRIRSVAATVIDDVEKNLELLAMLYDKYTYVHNTANIRRHDATLREITKTCLTSRARRLAALEVNQLLAQRIAAHRAADAKLILFDELELLDHHSELALGRTIYASAIQHPAELGRQVAHRYREVLNVHADLMGKKVVVCDLDNTLWKGEIGEGPIKHFGEFQQVLKDLRQKGILLAVNSKNDPRNVHWDGAVLNEDDFVNLQINWDSKVSNMRRIQQALNLKLKDFAFIDDRADQRSMVTEAFPEIQVLDPTTSRSWSQLALWAAALPENLELDRTRQYHEREQRESFLTTAAINEDPATLFAKLEIRIEIREAKASELKRITELINRTNQFNLAGSRTSLPNVREWHNSLHKHIIVVDAADKYGSMGLVCVASVQITDSEISIPVFVLSCRVFGYGIENAVLNALKRKAHSTSQWEGRPIRGEYRETSYNEPCRKMYPDNGFSWDGQSWILQQIDSFQDPTWLTIVDHFSNDVVNFA